MPVSIDRRAPADTPSDARRPPAFCRLNLPHFSPAYGRLVRVFKPAGLRLSRRTRRSASPFQADTLGRRHRSVRTQQAGGRRGKLRNRESRTPEREGRRSTDAPVALSGVLRGWADCERGPPMGPKPNRRHTPYAALWFLSGGAERNSPFRAKTEPARRGETRQKHRAFRHPPAKGQRTEDGISPISTLHSSLSTLRPCPPAPAAGGCAGRNTAGPAGHWRSSGPAAPRCPPPPAAPWPG